MKFRKNEIKYYDILIEHIRDEVISGRDFWASLFSGGLTFTDDIEKFYKYALAVGAYDISNEIIKKHLEWK